MSSFTTRLAHLRAELRPTLRLAAPLILAELGWMAMSVVDTIMAGRLPEGAVAIGAVSLGSHIFNVVGIFGSALLFGLDPLVAQSYGAGRIEDCHRSLWSGLLLVAGLTPLLMGAAWLGEPFLKNFGIAPDTLAYAIPYLRAVIWSTGPLLLFTALRRYLQALHHVGVLAFALVSANLLNAFANWALIFGHLGMPAMRAEGAGWATCFSRIYMALVLLLYVLWLERSEQFRLRGTELHRDWERLRELFRLGLPAALQFSLEVGVFAAATALAGRLGAVPLAAHQIALQTAALMYMVPLGIASAAAVRVGHAIGRGDSPGARRAGWTAIALGAGFMSGSALLFVLVPEAIVRLYTTDMNLLPASVLLLTIAAFFQFFDGLQTVATGALRGAGDTRTPMICHMLAYWVIGLPLGYWLCFHMDWGAAGLWAGLSLALILIGIVLLLAWRRRALRLS